MRLIRDVDVNQEVYITIKKQLELAKIDESKERLFINVPRQEVGRLSYKELTLSRANKSVRIFDYVVDNLSKGNQPNKEHLSKVGYLYRTTAVYGSGKFGLADRFRIKNRKEIYGPFRLEMMLVYLVRQFTFDQVNHIAKCKNPKDAVKLDINICRNLGIGNSTGLGMAPFIIKHPKLINKWMTQYTNTLGQIFKIDLENGVFKKYEALLNKALNYLEEVNTSDQFQINKNKVTTEDLKKYIFYILLCIFD